MRCLIKISVAVIASLWSCAPAHRVINTELPPEAAAERIVLDNCPEEAAALLLDWLQEADTSSRAFACRLVAKVLYNYDSIGAADSSARFVTSFDGQTSRLDIAKQAHVLLVLNTPDKIGASLARSPSRHPLALKVDSVLVGNPAALQSFRDSYEKYKSIYNRLKNENDTTICADN